METIWNLMPQFLLGVLTEEWRQSAAALSSWRHLWNGCTVFDVPSCCPVLLFMFGACSFLISYLRNWYIFSDYIQMLRMLLVLSVLPSSKSGYVHNREFLWAMNIQFFFLLVKLKMGCNCVWAIVPIRHWSSLLTRVSSVVCALTLCLLIGTFYWNILENAPYLWLLSSSWC